MMGGHLHTPRWRQTYVADGGRPMLDQRIGLIGAAKWPRGLALGFMKAGLTSPDKLLASDIDGLPGSGLPVLWMPVPPTTPRSLPGPTWSFWQSSRSR